MTASKHSLARILVLAATVLAAAPGLRGAIETWSDRKGNTLEGELIAAYAQDAYFLTKKKTYVHFPIAVLQEADVERVVQWTQAWNPSRLTAVAAETSPSKLTQFLKANLQTLENDALVSVDISSRTEPEFYLFYFSAGWCGPCRRFTPGFIQVYNGLRASGYTNFEVIFVSSDESQKDMIRYMQEEKMPWFALRFGRRDASTVRRYAASGIPNLVVVDRDGHVLRHSYEGGQYVGPSEVLNAFQAMVVASNRTDRLPIGK